MILRRGTVAAVEGPVPGAGYPDPFNALGSYRAHPISDAGGLTRFGAFTEALMPGAQSSQRHWHEAEDAFLHALDGTVTVIEEEGEHALSPGDAACRPAGVANAHCLVNRGASPVTYLIVGTRARDDACHDPDIDLHHTRRDGVRCMSRKEGTPYPGWPKGAENG